MIDIHSKTSNKKCCIIVATNMYKKGLMHNDIECIIRQIVSTSKIQCLTPFLKFHRGMKVLKTRKITRTKVKGKV